MKFWGKNEILRKKKEILTKKKYWQNNEIKKKFG
mgnify:CR=1 FL=1